jgi:hypothetical protein
MKQALSWNEGDVTFLPVLLKSHVMVRHKSGKHVTSGEDCKTDGRASLASMGNEEDERNEREEKTWTGKEIENPSIM